MRLKRSEEWAVRELKFQMICVHQSGYFELSLISRPSVSNSILAASKVGAAAQYLLEIRISNVELLGGNEFDVGEPSGIDSVSVIAINHKLIS